MLRGTAKTKHSIHALVAAGLWWVLLGQGTVLWSTEDTGQGSGQGPPQVTSKAAGPRVRGMNGPDQQGGGKPKRRGVVKIATIGCGPASVAAGAEPQEVVDKMIAHWRGRLDQVLPDKPDLIVVPEACDRPGGFGAEQLRRYYHVRQDQVQRFFADVAKENKCYIVYSAYREMPDGTRRNSSVLIDRKGDVVGIYNKNHPTIGEIEQGTLCGKDAPIFECDFGRVAMAICFDLNFDELRLKYVKGKPDLLIFSSMYHGGLMQAYWAYSCRCHFVGAIAGRATPSQIYNPLGEVVASTTNYFDFAVATVNLDCALAHLDYNGQRLRRLKAKYGPKVKITDPGRLGAVLIASEHETISVDDMIREFEIEPLDDYFTRALAHHHKPQNIEKGEEK